MELQSAEIQQMAMEYEEKAIQGANEHIICVYCVTKERLIFQFKIIYFTEGWSFN